MKVLKIHLLCYLKHLKHLFDCAKIDLVFNFILKSNFHLIKINFQMTKSLFMNYFEK